MTGFWPSGAERRAPGGRQPPAFFTVDNAPHLYPPPLSSVIARALRNANSIRMSPKGKDASALGRDFNAPRRWVGIDYEVMAGL
jgi:hypothetical protein